MQETLFEIDFVQCSKSILGKKVHSNQNIFNRFRERKDRHTVCNHDIFKIFLKTVNKNKHNNNKKNILKAGYSFGKIYTR